MRPSDLFLGIILRVRASRLLHTSVKPPLHKLDLDADLLSSLLAASDNVPKKRKPGQKEARVDSRPSWVHLSTQELTESFVAYLFPFQGLRIAYARFSTVVFPPLGNARAVCSRKRSPIDAGILAFVECIFRLDGRPP